MQPGICWLGHETQNFCKIRNTAEIMRLPISRPDANLLHPRATARRLGLYSADLCRASTNDAPQYPTRRHQARTGRQLWVKYPEKPASHHTEYHRIDARILTAPNQRLQFSTRRSYACEPPMPRDGSCFSLYIRCRGPAR